MVRNALLVFLLAICSAACSAQSPTSFATPIPNRIAPHQDSEGSGSQPDISDLAGASQVQVILVPSELILGENRFAVGLIDPSKGMLRDASVHFRYFDLSNPSSPVLESEAEAIRLQTPDGLQTIFAQERGFSRAGNWGAEIQARYPDGTTTLNRISFQVVSHSATLKPGQSVPALNTRTTSDVGGNLKLLSSAPTPNPVFYRQSLASALKNGKPTLLLFATPAFCQSRLCGPAYDIVSSVQKRIGDAINYIHVEVYSGLPNPEENNYEVDPAMKAFGLETEPWAFIIDGGGIVTYRVEGLFTEEEIESHLKPLLDH